MKTLFAVVLVAAIVGCASQPRYDTMLCAVEMDGKCLQWDRFQSLRSVQQARVKP